MNSNIGLDDVGSASKNEKKTSNRTTRVSNLMIKIVNDQQLYQKLSDKYGSNFLDSLLDPNSDAKLVDNIENEITIHESDLKNSKKEEVNHNEKEAVINRNITEENSRSQLKTLETRSDKNSYNNVRFTENNSTYYYNKNYYSSSVKDKPLNFDYSKKSTISSFRK